MIKKNQNNVFLKYSKKEPLYILFTINGNINKATNAKNNIITPPNLLGIDLRIA
jgi:hypothetical protein